MMSRAAVVRRFALRNHTDPSALRQPFAASSSTGKMSAKELSKALGEQEEMKEFLNQSKSEAVVKAVFGLIKKVRFYFFGDIFSDLFFLRSCPFDI